MKNLNKYGVTEIITNESSLISGGGWLYDLGAAAHNTWCSLSEWASNYEHDDPYFNMRAGGL